MTHRLHAHGAHLHTHDHHGPHRHLLHPRRSGATVGRTGALANQTYRRLLAAQIIALAGTGLTTVALGLLAYDLAGGNAGAVLGGILALKMVAYVGLSPVIAAFAHRIDRRRLLIGLDLVRAAVLCALPFVTEIWQVVVLVFIVNACAAGFTPAFQATIPEVLTDESEYTRALSLSRLAYDLSDLLAPLGAAALLLIVGFDAMFVLNATAFLASAALVGSVTLPDRRGPVSERTMARILVGVRSYVRVPELRGLLALSVAVAAASAMTIVNTVVIVREDLGRGDGAVALALGAAGAGAAITALLVPRLLARTDDRRVMIAGGLLLVLGLGAATMRPGFIAVLVIWLVLGIGLSLAQTPAGRLIQRASNDATRQPLFAAQFSLSHACWLVTYPVAGVLGTVVGVNTILAVLCAVAAASVATAMAIWRPSRMAGPAQEAS